MTIILVSIALVRSLYRMPIRSIKVSRSGAMFPLFGLPKMSNIILKVVVALEFT